MEIEVAKKMKETRVKRFSVLSIGILFSSKDLYLIVFCS